MQNSLQISPDDPTGLRAALPSREAARVCFHCGTPNRGASWTRQEKVFCCRGCLTVYELLVENGLDEFYRLNPAGGAPVQSETNADQYRFLDEPSVRQRLVDFCDGRQTQVSFRLPAIHCIACVWLLENLFRLKAGLGGSQVNFQRREVRLSFDPNQIKLSDVAGLLAELGYSPDLKLSDLDGKPRKDNRRLWLQLGVAGFAFGNIMLFSIPVYFGLESSSLFQKWFGYLSFALACPVVLYSAQDYWRAAWVSLRQRSINIEVPIALGLLALFVQSSVQVLTARGEGYFDSLAGLVFFLLCGKWFQQRAYDRLAFDRDYKSFFPLSVTRRSATADGENPCQVALSEVAVGDRLVIRHGELIPADSRLVEGVAVIDYSFVTGESEPVAKSYEDHLFAGGRQMGAAIEVETLKPVSQSYLTSLWNQAVFRKEKVTSLQTLTNRFSRWFTVGVIAIAIGAGLFWLREDPTRAVRSFTAVLIVACPCALALSAPFALGTAQRALGAGQVFLKNAEVLEALAQIDTLVFDKTGTLTLAGGGKVRYLGNPLHPTELGWIAAMSRQSTHPLAVRIAQALDPHGQVQWFREVPGSGMHGQVDGHDVRLGSEAWLTDQGVEMPVASGTTASVVHVALDGRYQGRFTMDQGVRPEMEGLLKRLADRFRLVLLSGDRERRQAGLERLFGGRQAVHFEQTPLAKLEYVEGLQRGGHAVCMVGDGLNDAGALQQSNVGVAVVERVGMFSPASDVIVPASLLPRLDSLFHYARLSTRVILASFGVSLLYNAVGIFFAARGVLSPVICAILMPLSSVTVVAFASGMTRWLGRRMGWKAWRGGES